MISEHLRSGLSPGPATLLRFVSGSGFGDAFQKAWRDMSGPPSSGKPLPTGPARYRSIFFGAEDRRPSMSEVRRAHREGFLDAMPELVWSARRIGEASRRMAARGVDLEGVVATDLGYWIVRFEGSLTKRDLEVVDQIALAVGAYPSPEAGRRLPDGTAEIRRST